MSLCQRLAVPREIGWRSRGRAFARGGIGEIHMPDSGQVALLWVSPHAPGTLPEPRLSTDE